MNPTVILLLGASAPSTCAGIIVGAIPINAAAPAEFFRNLRRETVPAIFIELLLLQAPFKGQLRNARLVQLSQTKLRHTVELLLRRFRERQLQLLLLRQVQRNARILRRMRSAEETRMLAI